MKTMESKNPIGRPRKRPIDKHYKLCKMQSAVFPVVERAIASNELRTVDDVISAVRVEMPMLTPSHAARLVESIEKRNFIRKDAKRKTYVVSDGKIEEE